jgi:hypothetical protein
MIIIIPECPDECCSDKGWAPVGGSHQYQTVEEIRLLERYMCNSKTSKAISTNWGEKRRSELLVLKRNNRY